MKVTIGKKVSVRMHARDMLILNDKRPGADTSDMEAWIHDVGLVVEEFHTGGVILYRLDFDPDVDGRSVWLPAELLEKPTPGQEDHTAGMFR